MRGLPYQGAFGGNAKVFGGEDPEVEEDDGDFDQVLHEDVEDLGDVVELGGC